MTAFSQLLATCVVLLQVCLCLVALTLASLFGAGLGVLGVSVSTLACVFAAGALDATLVDEVRR